jgi:hypothetical protein
MLPFVGSKTARKRNFQRRTEGLAFRGSTILARLALMHETSTVAAFS